MAAPAPSTAGGAIMRGGPDPPVAVQPNASDIFYAVAVGIVQSVGSSCGEVFHPFCTAVLGTECEHPWSRQVS